MKKCSMLQPIFICTLILVLIAGFDSAIAVNSDTAYFTNPPSSDSDTDNTPSYELGSVQQISWTTNLDIFNISIWQRDRENGSSASGGNIFAKTTPSETIDSFSWAVQAYTFDLDLSSIFFLAIESDPHSWTSTNFTITSSSSNSSSTSSSSSSSSSPSSSKSVDTSPPESTTTAEPTSLTSTGKIALGLGVGIGTPLISLLAILAYFQYRSVRRAYIHSGPHPHPHPLSHSHSHSHPPPMGYPSPSPATEQLPTIPSVPPQPSVPVSVYRNLSPSELPQKPARPVYLPPWEVHSRSAAPVPIPAPAGLGVGDWNGNGNGRVSRPGARSMSTRSSMGLGIPELPGESYNYI